MMRSRDFIIAAAVMSCCSLTNAEGLDPDSYPVASELSYGSVSVQVRPERYVKLKAPISGRLHLKIRSGTHEKGTVWAEFEPGQIALEREAMDLTNSLHELKELPASRLEMADSRAALENRRDDLKRNLSTVDEILSEPDLAELYLGGKGGDSAKSRSTVQEMRGRLMKQIAAIEEALNYVGTPEQERIELRLSRIQIERKEAELKRKEREAILELPFSGEFRYLAQLPEDPDAPLVMQSGDEIAELSDYGSLECDMVVSRPALRQLPLQSLSLTFQSQSGSPLRAEFVRKETREVYGKAELIYVFGFPGGQAVAARSLIGGRVSADLMVELPVEAAMVPKLDLIRAANDVFREKGWNGGVEMLLPGYRAIAVGQSRVAITRKLDGNE